MDSSGVPPSGLAPYDLAIIMERVRLQDRWQTERWETRGVVRDLLPAGSREQILVRDETRMQMLFPGFSLRLHPDEAEGYYYNVTSPQPKLFVMWRLQDGIARPERISASYHEGARWMDAEETVDGVALPADFMPWISAYAAHHYRPEAPKKKRYASSRDRGVASRRDGNW